MGDTKPDLSRLAAIGMQERVLLLGGHLAIESSPGAGTTITAVLPLDKTGERPERMDERD
jgi:signal transduction histidine kinase